MMCNILEFRLHDHISKQDDQADQEDNYEELEYIEVDLDVAAPDSSSPS